MFYDMRRTKQLMSDEEAEAILEEGTSGVLSLLGDNGYTYGVPLSYVKVGDRIYFHSAVNGHKLDAIRNHDRVSFTVIAEDSVLPDMTSTKYRSVIVFGRVRLAETDEEKTQALTDLGKKISPHRTEYLEGVIERKLKHTAVIILEIEHITGKKAIEFFQKSKSE